MLEQKLRELGFSEKEVGVYLALLETGSAVASDIGKKARINRSTTYVVLDALAARGLVSMTDRQGVKLYNSTPPEQLVQYLEGMAKRYAGLADTAKELLPELESSRARKTTKPKVQLFEGAHGVKTVYEDTLASLDEMRVYASFHNSGADLLRDAPVGANRNGSGMQFETIVINSRSEQKQVSSNKKATHQTLITKRAARTLSSEINIYDNRVVFISAAENFGLIVESRELADALKKAFNKSTSEPKDAYRTSDEPDHLSGGTALV